MNPPDRAAVERHAKQLEYARLSGTADVLRILWHRLELAEREKAEAVAQRDKAIAQIETLVTSALAMHVELVPLIDAGEAECRATEAQRDEAVALLHTVFDSWPTEVSAETLEKIQNLIQRSGR